MKTSGVSVGMYCRVSTTGQTVENQRSALAAHGAARGWRIRWFLDEAISGKRERRPGLDALMEAARRREIDVVACVKLDRLARSTHHLVTLSKELEALGMELVVTEQAIDTTTPTGRL